MYYDEIVKKIVKVVEDADRSIPDHFKSMNSMEKTIFLCYQFYHMGYADGKEDRDMGSCSHEH